MKRVAVIVLCVFSALLCFHLGRKSVEMPQFGDVVVQVDTVVTCDTFVFAMPPVLRVETIGALNARVADTVRHDGELVMSIPLERKVYETTQYRAEVSGYMASLDRLEIYGENRQVTRYVQTGLHRNRLYIGTEPVWLGSFHTPLMVDYMRAVVPWLEVGGGVGYEPISRQPVIRASARVCFSW